MQRRSFVAQDATGKVLPLATVYVYQPNTTTQATVYSDDGVTVITQPITADSLGRFSFFALRGEYDVAVTYRGNTSTVEDVEFLDDSDSDFDDVSALLASTKNYVAGQIIRTREEGFAYEVAASGATDHHLTTAGGVKLYIIPNRGEVDVKAAGATGTGDETAEFEIAALAAAGGTVVIPFSAFTVSTSGADAQGCAVRGVDTTLTGYILGARDMRGVTQGTIPQGVRAIHPVIPADNDTKLIQRFSTNLYRAFSPSLRGGYMLTTLVNNVTTNAADSLAGSATAQTMWRVNGIVRCVEVLTGYLTASSVNGTWTATTLTTGVPAYTSGTYYNYQRSTTIGAWREFTVTVPNDGYLSVCFLASASASDDVTITVDGVAIDSNFSTQSSTVYRMLREYRVAPGSRAVRITNNTAGSTGLNVVGLYFAPLARQREDVPVDIVGYYRNSARTDPIGSNSANDFAIWDADAERWGGSYHGGESGFSETWHVNDGTVSLSVGDFALGKSIEVVQSCTVDWSSLGGATLGVRTVHRLIRGGYALSATFTGTVNARDFYPTLFGISEDYGAIVDPEQISLSGLVDGTRQPLRKGNAVEYQASNGDTLRITHSVYEDAQVKEGGPYIWHVVGSYDKYYNGLVTSGSKACTDIHAVNILQCS